MLVSGHVLHEFQCPFTVRGEVETPADPCEYLGHLSVLKDRQARTDGIIDRFDRLAGKWVPRSRIPKAET